MVRSCSQPEMIAFNPNCRIRHNSTLYPFRRSPFKYASSTRRSDFPSISLRTISHTCNDMVTSLIFRLCYYMVTWLRCDSRRNLMRVV
jgi:hypothetical protein